MRGAVGVREPGTVVVGEQFFHDDHFRTRRMREPRERGEGERIAQIDELRAAEGRWCGEEAFLRYCSPSR